VAASGDDTWQVTGRTTSDLNQLEGDTCHHCKGDTWHGVTWQEQWHVDMAVWLLTGHDWTDTSIDTWANRCLARSFGE
jgi:hypothetical protein